MTNKTTTPKRQAEDAVAAGMTGGPKRHLYGSGVLMFNTNGNEDVGDLIRQQTEGRLVINDNASGTGVQPDAANETPKASAEPEADRLVGMMQVALTEALGIQMRTLIEARANAKEIIDGFDNAPEQTRFLIAALGDVILDMSVQIAREIADEYSDAARVLMNKHVADMSPMQRHENIERGRVLWRAIRKRSEEILLEHNVPGSEANKW